MMRPPGVQIWLRRRVTVTLTFDLLIPKLNILSACPIDNLRQFSANSINSFLKYRVTNKISGMVDYAGYPSVFLAAR